MANGDQPLRPNPQRSVEIFGEFTDELASRVSSDITRLRALGNDPITVYINSIGGGIRELDIIDGNLRCEDLDRNPCFFVTVAIGNALSAGANLLAFGHYAYVRQHSIIHFHGARSSDLPDAFEDAAQMATGLQKLNRSLSQRLAVAVIGRIVFRYQSIKSTFDRRRIPKNTPVEFLDLACFLNTIARRLSGPARRVVRETYEKMIAARELTEKILPKVLPKMGKRRINLASDDAKVLTGVIQHELREHKGPQFWRLDERGVDQIVSDYFLIRDYNLGEHVNLVEELLETFGAEFLDSADAKVFEKIPVDDENKQMEFLGENASPNMLPLWYFTVTLCRQLMLGENRLTPTDAYLLGIVDEVIGTGLTGWRLVEEQLPPDAPAASEEPKPAS